jgi:hypothetical protein
MAKKTTPMYLFEWNEILAAGKTVTQDDDSQAAFNKAIQTGRLSGHPSAANYVGNYMYMGTNEADKDLFKHIDTREYIK